MESYLILRGIALVIKSLILIFEIDPKTLMDRYKRQLFSRIKQDYYRQGLAAQSFVVSTHLKVLRTQEACHKC